MKERSKTKLAIIGYLFIVFGMIIAIHFLCINGMIISENMILYNVYLITITLFDAFLLGNLFWIFFLSDKFKIVRRE